MWVRDGNLHGLLKNTFQLGRRRSQEKDPKMEESLIRNQAQRIKERLNRDTGNWKSNI